MAVLQHEWPKSELLDVGLHKWTNYCGAVIVPNTNSIPWEIVLAIIRPVRYGTLSTKGFTTYPANKIERIPPLHSVIHPLRCLVRAVLALASHLVLTHWQLNCRVLLMRDGSPRLIHHQIQRAIQLDQCCIVVEHRVGVAAFLTVGKNESAIICRNNFTAPRIC